MKNALKPCPFCGNNGPEFDTGGGTCRWVICNDCGTEGPSADSKRQAAARWNERVHVEHGGIS